MGLTPSCLVPYLSEAPERAQVSIWTKPKERAPNGTRTHRLGKLTLKFLRLSDSRQFAVSQKCQYDRGWAGAAAVMRDA